MQLKFLFSTTFFLVIVCLRLTAADGDGQNLENQCRPYVEKALKDKLTHQLEEASSDENDVQVTERSDEADGAARETTDNEQPDESDESKQEAEIEAESETDEQPQQDASQEASEEKEDEPTEQSQEETPEESGQSSEESDKEETAGDVGDAEATDAEASNAEASDAEGSDAEASDAEASNGEATDAEATDAEATDGETSDEVNQQDEQSIEDGDKSKEDTGEQGNDEGSVENDEGTQEDGLGGQSKEDGQESKEDGAKDDGTDVGDSKEESGEVNVEEKGESTEENVEGSKELDGEGSKETEVDVSKETDGESSKETNMESSKETDGEVSKETDEESSKETDTEVGKETEAEASTEAEVEASKETEVPQSPEEADSSTEVAKSNASDETTEDQEQADSSKSGEADQDETVNDTETKESESVEAEPIDDSKHASDEATGDAEADESTETAEATTNDDGPSEKDEDELTKEFIIPDVLRSRNPIVEILGLDDRSGDVDLAVARAADVTLKDLKHIYDQAVKPLENLYKYRDLSNRHFGDPEIFSKPLILFMGPWSGGKSSIINYLLNNEYNETTLRTGAEPSPAYFNILMHGAEPEVIDGTTINTDWAFAGLQKFGQGLEDRLRGLKLPNKLLEKVNIVEIPGILEVRKQVSRSFPFNDACQWFIDRADVIFLVYDPSKLDVGPETEAILDQLKGREYQTRVILNKADTVKAEELLRVQSALIWNISPLMASSQPPVMYTTSLWSTPYNEASPVRLLQAQERAFLRDLRQAIEKRVENKIASARRFAVRVRNHAKMVDCYLTTYYNHKTFFGNRKQIADEIIEHPQDYHIYEGISTLKNISRYDLPDPDTYKDFFRLNPVWEFQALSATCTYFKGCPIQKLDVAIAYDFPELLGKYRKQLEKELERVKS